MQVRCHRPKDGSCRQTCRLRRIFLDELKLGHSELDHVAIAERAARQRSVVDLRTCRAAQVEYHASIFDRPQEGVVDVNLGVVHLDSTLTRFAPDDRVLIANGEALAQRQAGLDHEHASTANAKCSGPHGHMAELGEEQPAAADAYPAASLTQVPFLLPRSSSSKRPETSRIWACSELTEGWLI